MIISVSGLVAAVNITLDWRTSQRGDINDPDIDGSDVMKKLWLVVTAVILLGLVAAGIFLITWDIPAPSERVERTLPDDDFPR